MLLFELIVIPILILLAIAEVLHLAKVFNRKHKGGDTLIISHNIQAKLESVQANGYNAAIQLIQNYDWDHILVDYNLGYHSEENGLNVLRHLEQLIADKKCQAPSISIIAINEVVKFEMDRIKLNIERKHKSLRNIVWRIERKFTFLIISLMILIIFIYILYVAAFGKINKMTRSSTSAVTTSTSSGSTKTLILKPVKHLSDEDINLFCVRGYLYFQQDLQYGPVGGPVFDAYGNPTTCE